MTGLIETIRVRGGTVPWRDRHQARLAASVAALGIGTAPELEPLVAPHASGDAVVRVEVHSGRLPAVTTRPVPPADSVRVILAREVHAPYPHKTTDRACFDAARAEALAAGADEALLCTASGALAEGSYTTLFFWQDEVLCTPARTLRILPGIGRGRVLELARAFGIPLIEGPFRPADLAGRPLFLVNAVRGVVPAALAPAALPSVHSGTYRLAAAFWP